MTQPARLTQVAEVAKWLTAWQPEVVAVDSPRSPAPGEDLSRKGERNLVRARVCGIRYTPNASALAANPGYYGWILHGLELYAALAAGETSGAWRVIECFPTATWSRLGGPRGGRTRARWSREILLGAGLGGLPARMNQDARDAIGAALTARLFAAGQTEFVRGHRGAAGDRVKLWA